MGIWTWSRSLQCPWKFWWVRRKENYRAWTSSWCPLLWRGMEYQRRNNGVKKLLVSLQWYMISKWKKIPALADLNKVVKIRAKFSVKHGCNEIQKCPQVALQDAICLDIGRDATTNRLKAALPSRLKELLLIALQWRWAWENDALRNARGWWRWLGSGCPMSSGGTSVTIRPSVCPTHEWRNKLRALDSDQIVSLCLV